MRNFPGVGLHQPRAVLSNTVFPLPAGAQDHAGFPFKGFERDAGEGLHVPERDANAIKAEDGLMVVDGHQLPAWLTKILAMINVNIKISIEAVTIAWVVARPTPCVPPEARSRRSTRSAAMANAKTKGFNSPEPRRSLQRAPGRAPVLPRVDMQEEVGNHQPPKIPTKSAMMVSSGSMVQVAMSRGVTASGWDRCPARAWRRSGSVTFIEPSRCHAGKVAARHHQGRQHRSQFAHQRDRNQGAGPADLPVIRQRTRHLQRHHRSAEEPGEHGDGETADSDDIHLEGNVVAVVGERKTFLRALPASKKNS